MALFRLNVVEGLWLGLFQGEVFAVLWTCVERSADSFCIVEFAMRHMNLMVVIDPSVLHTKQGERLLLSTFFISDQALEDAEQDTW